MRQPMQREKGRYIKRLDVENIAVKVVEELCDLYPEVDIIDIRVQFMGELAFQFARRLAVETIEKE